MGFICTARRLVVVDCCAPGGALARLISCTLRRESIRNGSLTANRNLCDRASSNGVIGMPLIGDSHKPTTTDTARTAATSNVKFPLPVYHRLGIGQGKFRAASANSLIYFFFIFIEVSNGITIIARANI